MIDDLRLGMNASNREKCWAISSGGYTASGRSKWPNAIHESAWFFACIPSSRPRLYTRTAILAILAHFHFICLPRRHLHMNPAPPAPSTGLTCLVLSSGGGMETGST